MAAINRGVAENLATRLMGLGQHRWSSTDSTVWTPEDRPGQVVKVTQMDVGALRAHRRMVTLGDAFPHVARVFDVRPIAFSHISTREEAWFFCIVVQRLMVPVPGVVYDPPPISWDVDGDTYQQYDGSYVNHIAGVWVDLARVKRSGASRG